MNSRDRFMAACKRQTLDRPPVWVMRQAGRYLPEYRALKEKYTFVEMVQTPELAVEVTMQPLTRFALDAAILFSDILVIPEAMGQKYQFRDGGGIEMEFKADTSEIINKLDPSGVEDRLSYVFNTLSLLKTELKGEKALIGFGGAPWTLATYMVEGGSSRNFAHVKELFFSDRKVFDSLMVKLTEALIKYFSLQVEAGADVIQVFDSWGGALAPGTFWDASGKYLKTIVDSLKGKVPVIVFSRGAHAWTDCLKRIDADVLGVDTACPIGEFYDIFKGKTAVQGNMDPVVMNTTPEIVASQSTDILETMRTRPGHIFNLGHGILPQAHIECMEALVTTVRNFQN